MVPSKTGQSTLSFDPSDCISGKMMRCNRIVANIFRKHLLQFNITDSQLSIVFVISKIQKANQKKIADVLYLDKSTVNRNINRLLANNIIAYVDGKDLGLTEAGELLRNTITPHWKKAMAEISSILTTEGEQALNIITTRLTN